MVVEEFGQRSGLDEIRAFRYLVFLSVPFDEPLFDRFR